MPETNATPDPNAAPIPNAAPDPNATPDPNAAPAPNGAPDPNATPDPNAAPDPNKPAGAPEAYDFKPLEGQQFDPEFIKVYSDVAKELDLPQDKAQALIDKISPVLEQRQMAKIEEVRTGWMEASKIDKEFGGDKLEANLGIAKAALDQFGTPELKELLNASGIGNHPEVIRYFYKVGKATSADTFVGGRKEGKGVPQNFNEQAARLYPNQ